MTKKGDQCRRSAAEGSSFCAIHQDQEIRPRTTGRPEWDADSILKAAVGMVLVAGILIFRLRR